ncbi:cation diffusion facilitator family transporter [Anaeroselena agilis]|uniref:cation diffusion facilitator family transporter n=1 Tax=Anaeroselena agilis TaxID=3063788 RepID=UPI0039B6F23E
MDHNTLKQNTARLSIFSNTALVIFKLAVGLAGGAVSIVSEAAHSAVDLIAALIAYFAVRKAAKPPDEHHAYGHGKVESLSAAIEAALIVLAALWIVYEAVDKLTAGHTPAYLEYGIAVMAVSILVNWYVSGRLMKVAHETRSHALEADALHLKADIWTSCGVLGGLVVIKITGLTWLDPAIAIVVAAFVFKAGYDMTKKSLYELTDVSLPPEEEEIIANILTAHPAILAFHQLRTRRSGSLRLIDVHVILRRDMHLDAAHAVCDEVEASLEVSLSPCEATIHLEPCTCPDK